MKMIQSTGMVLDVDNIDTDQIIPAKFLKSTEKSGFGEHLFANWRYQENGELITSFVLNQSPKSRSVLIAGNNFGCGSSREHAAWAISDFGIRAIISSQFADIFKGNAEKNGILCITLEEKIVQQFLKSGERLSVDLEAQLVIDEAGHQYPFEIPSFSKKRLLEDLSDLDYLLDFKHTVQEFSKRQKMLGL